MGYLRVYLDDSCHVSYSGRASCCVAGSSLGGEAQTDPRTYGHGSPSPSTAF